MADPTTPPNHPRTEEELAKDLSIGQKGPTPYQSSATHDETGGPHVAHGDVENPNAAKEASGLDEELEGPANQQRNHSDEQNEEGADQYENTSNDTENGLYDAPSDEQTEEQE